MKKYNNILIKNIVILLTTGAVTKILGMIGKIIYTRTAGIDVVSLYALITPTLMLIISITQFSFPITISKLSAEEKYNNEDLYRQIEDITQLTFNNLSNENVIVNIKYADSNGINNISIAANNKYTLISQGSKDIVSIVPQSDIYIDYNYILSTKVIESEE